MAARRGASDSDHHMYCRRSCFWFATILLSTRIKILTGLQQPKSAGDTNVKRFILRLLVRSQVTRDERLASKRNSKNEEISSLIVLEWCDIVGDATEGKSSIAEGSA